MFLGLPVDFNSIDHNDGNPILEEVTFEEDWGPYKKGDCLIEIIIGDDRIIDGRSKRSTGIKVVPTT